MNATMAIMARDVMARRELLLLAVAVAIVISFLPFLPNIEAYEATDVRTVASSVSALALGCLLALILGATIIGNDLSEGRFGFFFARPVSGLAVWWGRVLAVMVLIWIVEVIVLVPALYHEGMHIFTSGDVIDWLTVLAYVLVPLLLFLVAHTMSIIVRAGTPWMFLDLGGAIVFALFAWLNVKPIYEIAAPIALMVVAGALLAALLLSLSVGGAMGVAAGRVDLPRVHSAQSLALWSTMAVCLAAITLYGGWLRDFGPRQFEDIDVMTVSPDGLWVEVSGGAKDRLDVRRRYLLSTTADRWVPLPAHGDWFDRLVTYSPDGSTAVWWGGGSVEEPRLLWWADLGRPDPMARATNLVVSPEAALTLSVDGARLAIVEEGNLSVYELEEERLLKAIRLPADFQRVGATFVASSKLRLFTLKEEGEILSLRIAEVDVASGELSITGEVSGHRTYFWFSFDADVEHMIVWTRPEGSIVAERRLHDAKNGALIRNLDGGGRARFLQDGRIMLSSESKDNSVTVNVESVGGEGRIVHTLRAADGSVVGDEAVPNRVIVLHLVDPTDRAQGMRVSVLDLETGETRNIASHLRGTVRWYPWQSGVGMGFHRDTDQPAVSRLFIDQSGALVRWDPESGEMVHVAGGQK